MTNNNNNNNRFSPVFYNNSNGRYQLEDLKIISETSQLHFRFPKKSFGKEGRDSENVRRHFQNPEHVNRMLGLSLKSLHQGFMSLSSTITPIVSPFWSLLYPLYIVVDKEEISPESLLLHDCIHACSSSLLERFLLCRGFFDAILQQHLNRA